MGRITALVADAGAKVLLVGDHAQLQAIDAGGAFSMLCKERGTDDDAAYAVWRADTRKGLRTLLVTDRPVPGTTSRRQGAGLERLMLYMRFWRRSVSGVWCGHLTRAWASTSPSGRALPHIVQRGETATYV